MSRTPSIPDSDYQFLVGRLDARLVKFIQKPDQIGLAAGQPTVRLDGDSGEFYAGETSERFKPTAAFQWLVDPSRDRRRNSRKACLIGSGRDLETVRARAAHPSSV
jgi:hypothetical protein